MIVINGNIKLATTKRNWGKKYPKKSLNYVAHLVPWMVLGSLNKILKPLTPTNIKLIGSSNYHGGAWLFLFIIHAIFRVYNNVHLRCVLRFFPNQYNKAIQTIQKQALWTQGQILWHFLGVDMHFIRISTSILNKSTF